MRSNLLTNKHHPPSNMEKALLMEQVTKAVGKLVDVHQKKASQITANGGYIHSEYETGTYSMGYSQALIDVYKKIRKI